MLQVIQDDMDIPVGGKVGDHLIHKLQEFDARFLCRGPCVDRCGRNFEHSEQSAGSVAAEGALATAHDAGFPRKCPVRRSRASMPGFSSMDTTRAFAGGVT